MLMPSYINFGVGVGGGYDRRRRGQYRLSPSPFSSPNVVIT